MIKSEKLGGRTKPKPDFENFNFPSTSILVPNSAELSVLYPVVYDPRKLAYERQPATDTHMRFRSVRALFATESLITESSTTIHVLQRNASHGAKPRRVP